MADLTSNIPSELNQPLRFKPIYKEKIWGGNRMRALLGKDTGHLPNCGESWEISGVGGDVSVLIDGSANLQHLLAQYQGLLTGKRVYARHGDEFPLLIKFLDANEDLSVQVHPNDMQARERHNCLGKTEMWYILYAEKDAELVVGFERDTVAAEYEAAMASNQVMDLLHREKVQPGDVLYIPAGRIHTIGKGIVLAEIQQSSDITYRIYDFDRTDAAGNKRELHTEQALGVLDFKSYPAYKAVYTDALNVPVFLAGGEYFHTHKLWLNQALERKLHVLDTLVIYICIAGSCQIAAGAGSVQLHKGQSCLIPACIADVQLLPDGECVLLETYVPAYHA